jgi:hypothetical protein
MFTNNTALRNVATHDVRAEQFHRGIPGRLSEPAHGMPVPAHVEGSIR